MAAGGEDGVLDGTNLHPADIFVIVLYFLIVLGFGLWVSAYLFGLELRIWLVCWAKQFIHKIIQSFSALRHWSSGNLHYVVNR